MPSDFSVLCLSLLSTALGVPSTKVPVDVAVFIRYVLPPMVCYFVLAFLALTPQTRTIRVALWPLVAFLALRAALSVDMSVGKLGRKILDVQFVSAMFSIATRTLDWTLAKEPLVRQLRPANSVPSIYMDTLDLVCNVRGHGWNWSHGLYVPRQTRPTTSRAAFAFRAFLSMISHAWICAVLRLAILSFINAGTGSVHERSTIFDETLPLLLRYFRSSLISVIVAFATYALTQMNYDASSLLGVLVFGQDTAQWPPTFDAPWRATSLTEFWGRRWHQWTRRTFLFLGGHPLSLLLGHAGKVLGSFLASAVFHQVMLVALDSRAEPWRMLVGFGMMAPGVLAEHAFWQCTGKKVGGATGWIWTMGWLVLWGNVLVEGFARPGLLQCMGFGDDALALLPVERLVIDFDRWLHAISG